MKSLFRPFLLLLVVFLVAIVCAGGVVWLSLQDLPSIDALKNYQPPQSTVVLDRHGEVVGRFYDERRTVIPVKSLPNHVKFAFIAAEDADFYDHRGIDYFGIMRAIVLEIKHWTVGGPRVGGSTITQQSARTMLLSSSQTYVRKLKEILLAKRIEDALSKDEILHLYLNQIYFGNGAYGIEEAAQTYFSKPAAKLSLYEAAALASIPKSPNRINPFNDAERLKQRQHYVLEQMERHKFIKPKEADAAKKAALFSEVTDGNHQLAPYFLRYVKSELMPKVDEETIRLGGLKVYSTLDIELQKNAELALSTGLREIDKRSGYRGPHLRPQPEDNDKLKAYLETFKKKAFVADNKGKVWDLRRLSKDNIKLGQDAVIDNIRLVMSSSNKIVAVRVASINEKANTAQIDLGSQTIPMALSHMAWARPYSNGEALKALPKKVAEILSPGDIILVKVRSDGKQLTAHLEQQPLINGGLIALDVDSGGILAMVGGYDFDRSPFNRITQAKRQPGSGLKPLIYSLAIDRELTTAASIIHDEPKAFFDAGTNEFWRPRNHTHKYLGDITVRKCLRSSINTCTITLLETIGLDGFLKFATEVGLSSPQTPYPRNLTLALGSGENYPIDVANAMRVLPSQGLYSPYYVVDEIKYPSKQREKMIRPESTRVMRPEAAFITSTILQEVVSESNRQNYLSHVNGRLAGKTGTTNNARSLWFFGYSPKILALVYIGYDDNRSIGVNEWGITTAFPIWARFMDSVPANREGFRFEAPEDIEWQLINRETGRAVLNDGILADGSSTMMEAFIRGTAPQPSDESIGARSSNPFMDEGAFAP